MTQPQPCEPVGALEVAGRLGVRRETVAMWKQRGLLPAARWTVSGQDAWDWNEDIRPWAEKTHRWPTGEDTDSRSTLDDEVDDEPVADSRETCWS